MTKSKLCVIIKYPPRGDTETNGKRLEKRYENEEYRNFFCSFGVLLLRERPGIQFHIGLAIMIGATVLMVKDTISLQHTHEHSHNHTHEHAHGDLIHSHEHCHIHSHTHIHGEDEATHGHTHNTIEGHDHSHID